MDDITIPIDDIVKNGLSINEYLLLYNINNRYPISGLIDSGLNSLVALERKGFIKLSDNDIFLRDKSTVFFAEDEDYFINWIEKYPTMVKKRHGGKRALSPASADTILGKRLKKKWLSIFKKDIEKQKLAIKVLELEIKDKTKSGDLEYMVEASRWLNEGYHEKYSYLVDEEKPQNHYENEDYM
tara:strand:+ start:3812 stop:4363 length:552 start_codon:yes stop_codon:yes gene_type:complete